MIFRGSDSPGESRMARLQVTDRFRSIYAEDGWIFSSSFSSLCSWWGQRSSPSPPLPVLLPACPPPGYLRRLGMLRGHWEDKVHVLGVETQVHPKMSEPGLRPSVRLPFIGGSPTFSKLSFWTGPFMNVILTHVRLPFPGRFQTCVYQLT